MGLRWSAAWGCVGAQHRGAALEYRWGCAGAQQRGATLECSVGLRRGAAAWDCAGVQRGAA